MNTDQLIALAEMNAIMLRAEGMKAENHGSVIRNETAVYGEECFFSLQRAMEAIIARMQKGM